MPEQPDERPPDKIVWWRQGDVAEFKDDHEVHLGYEEDGVFYDIWGNPLPIQEGR
jgi:hypothetical protein